MIHLPIDPDELIKQIEAIKPSWIARARSKAQENQSAGKYVSQKHPMVGDQVHLRGPPKKQVCLL